METKKTLIIVSILLVVLLGGASLLYAKLGNNIKPDNLLIQNDQTQANGQEGTENESVTPSGNSDTSDNNTADKNTENPAEDNTPFMAPDFTVYDREGNTVRLSDFRGKPVVLNFWASWCGPCKKEMPDFEEIYQDYGNDIHFVMVNLTDGAQETMKSATSFLDNSGYTFPVYYDTDVDAAVTYNVYAVPVTYFINDEGHLIAQGSGALDGDTIKRGIGMILE